MVNGPEKSLNNIFSQKFVPMPTKTSTVTRTTTGTSFNNPFISANTQNFKTENKTYGVNKPALNGYYAGEYNGKPNIVGKRLFLEA